MINIETQHQPELIEPELASAKRLRKDILTLGYVRPEIWRRVIDEEQSVIAEGLQGFIHIPFNFSFDGQTLRAVDGEDFMQIAENGVYYQKGQAEKDARYKFLLQRAIYNYEESQKAVALARGELQSKTIIIIEPYPEEEERLYGVDFVQSLGFQPSKKLALIRAIEKTEDGITMYTRGVEWSNLDLWNKALGTNHTTTSEFVGNHLESNAEATNILDVIQEAYSRQSGGVVNKSHDVWNFINTQSDLSNYFFAELERIARLDISDKELKQKINRVRYDYWSALKLGFEGGNNFHSIIGKNDAADIMHNAGHIMESRREIFAACGMSIKPASDLSATEMASEIFSKDVLKCVTCPYCKKIVDARIDKGASTIECLGRDCRAKVNTKTGERVDVFQKRKNHKDFGDLLVEFFFGNEQKKLAKKQHDLQQQKNKKIRSEKTTRF